MKIKPKQYAKVLMKLLEDKPVKEVKPLIAFFVKYLQNSQALHLKEQIVGEFARAYNKAGNITTVKVQSATPLPSSVKQNLQRSLAKSLAKKVELIDEVKTDLLGGLIITWEDNVIDNSWQAKISNLKNNLK